MPKLTSEQKKEIEDLLKEYAVESQKLERMIEEKRANRRKEGKTLPEDHLVGDMVGYAIELGIGMGDW